MYHFLNCIKIFLKTIFQNYHILIVLKFYNFSIYLFGLETTAHISISIFTCQKFQINPWIPKVRVLGLVSRWGLNWPHKKNQYFLKTLTNLDEFFKFRNFW